MSHACYTEVQKQKDPTATCIDSFFGSPEPASWVNLHPADLGSGLRRISRLLIGA